MPRILFYSYHAAVPVAVPGLPMREPSEQMLDGSSDSRNNHAPPGSPNLENVTCAVDFALIVQVIAVAPLGSTTAIWYALD